jgi:hypothetical protein
MLGVCRACSLKTVAKELAKCKFSLVAVQEAGWEEFGNQLADDYVFFYGNGNVNHH